MEKKSGFDRRRHAAEIRRQAAAGFSAKHLAQWFNIPVEEVNMILNPDKYPEKKSNAFTNTSVQDAKKKHHVTSDVCRETSCEWRCGPGRYCVLPSCFKQRLARKISPVEEEPDGCQETQCEMNVGNEDMKGDQ